MAISRSVPFTVSIMLCFSAISRAEMKVEEMEAKHAAIEKPAPELNAVARQLKISGHVELTVNIDSSGAVSAVKIEAGNPVLTS